MRFPQKTKKPNQTREIITSDLDQLASLQNNKNRRYIQLHAGKINARYRDAPLGKAQILKECLNVGARIEAAPDKSVVPFAYVLSSSGQFNFCGQEGISDTFVQASGGVWDITFKDNLEYIACAFDRDYFLSSYDLVIDRSAPDQYFMSNINSQISIAQRRYSRQLNYILNWLHSNTFIYNYPDIIRLLCSQVFKLAIDALPDANDLSALTCQRMAKRVKATIRVIDYLQAHIQELPDMQTLCRVGGVSERSLQYGFMDYLGVSPIQYLRILRLNRVRSGLLQANSAITKVTDVALNWGFIELGRFSKDYKQLFHELPSETLKQSV